MPLRGHPKSALTDSATGGAVSRHTTASVVIATTAQLEAKAEQPASTMHQLIEAAAATAASIHTCI